MENKKNNNPAKVTPVEVPPEKLLDMDLSRLDRELEKLLSLKDIMFEARDDTEKEIKYFTSWEAILAASRKLIAISEAVENKIEDLLDPVFSLTTTINLMNDGNNKFNKSEE